MRVVTNAGPGVIVTLNHGSGSPQEAAAWLAYANGDAARYNTPSDIALGTDSSGLDWKPVGYWARLRRLTAASNPDDAYDCQEFVRGLRLLPGQFHLMARHDLDGLERDGARRVAEVGLRFFRQINWRVLA
jgi:hypothetical protein